MQWGESPAPSKVHEFATAETLHPRQSQGKERRKKKELEKQKARVEKIDWKKVRADSDYNSEDDAKQTDGQAPPPQEHEQKDTTDDGKGR